MCGIVAVIGKYASAARREIEFATEIISHRGPDSAGYWTNGTDVALGFRRLAILDLSPAGNQPMTDNDGSTIVFNGEIYNYKDLERRMIDPGSCASACDTAVLLRALNIWGEAAMPLLEGMFAFVFWDAKSGHVLVGRDQFGIKPLYYWQRENGDTVFVSEIKSLFAFADFKFEVNRDVLPEYLYYRAISSPDTLCKNVYKVSAGTFASFYPGREITWKKYWNPLAVGLAIASDANQQQSLAGLNEKFDALFSETLKLHLISDVRIGTQFSGGVDSGIVGISASHENPIEGYYCRVENSLFDESEYARRIGKEHLAGFNETSLNQHDLFSADLEKATWHMDEPLGHPNAMGIKKISRIAKRNVKILLSGEGADEFFGGYIRYQRLLMAHILRSRLGKIHPAIGEILRSARIPSSLLSAASAMTDSEDIIEGTAFMPKVNLMSLLGNQAVEQATANRRDIYALIHKFRGLDVAAEAQLLDVVTYLEPLLSRQDKMSMASSIENRVPFVTPRMFAFAFALPAHQRASFSMTKRFLKARYERIVSRSDAQRPKWGFGIPLNTWLKGGSAQDRISKLTGAGSALGGIFEMSKIKAYASMPQAGDDETLWILISLEVWISEMKRFQAQCASHISK